MTNPEAETFPVAFLASGSGTTFESFCHSVVAYALPLEVRLVIGDRPGKEIFRKVEGINATYGWDIKSVLIDKDTYPDGPGEEKWEITDEQSKKMAEEYDKSGSKLAISAGFLSKIRGVFFDQHGFLPHYKYLEEADLVNTHPGLLPLTAGLWGPNVHKKTRDSGDDRTAQLLHVVEEQYDTGGIIAKNEVAVLPSYSWEDIEAAVQSKEKAFLAKDVLAFLIRREAFLNGGPGTPHLREAA